MCDEDQVYIKKGTGKGQCYELKSKIAQTYMIDNLLSKKPVDCNAIIAPKQLQGNCWLMLSLWCILLVIKVASF